MSKINWTLVLKKINTIFSGTIGTISTLITVASLIVGFFSKELGIIALAAFCLFLIILLITIIRFSNKVLRKSAPGNSHYGCDTKAVIIKYETDTGAIVIYESFKLVQAKQLVITHHPYEFKWSGSKDPVITSKFQSVEKVVKSGNDKEMDHAYMALSRPLLYNEVEYVHFYCVADDSDDKSKKKVGIRVSEHIDILHIRVILKHLSGMPKVPLLIKPINTQADVGYSPILEVPFDEMTKSYEIMVRHPKVGYRYLFEWEKVIPRGTGNSPQDSSSTVTP